MERNEPASKEFDFLASKKQLEGLLARLEATLRSSLFHENKFKSPLHLLHSKLDSCQFSVAVMALIKCGKSTLGNALLTAPLLPVDEKPQTQTIVRIWHHPNELKLLEDDKVVATDSSSIEKHLRAINKRILDTDKAENLKLDLHAGLHCLGNQSLDNVSFQILDTPGPNDEGVTHLKGKIEALLKEVDAIIYLLDATKLRSTDEERLLKQIPVYLLRSAADRIFIVVNKWEPNLKDQSLRKEKEEEDKNYVLDMLTKFLPPKEDGQCWIPKDHILLLSARKAYYARGFINKTLNEGELEYFKGMVDPSRAFLPLIPQEFLDRTLAQSAQTFLDESLITTFESRIISHTFNRSGYLVLAYVKDQMKELLNELLNTLKMKHITLTKKKIDPSVLEEIQKEIIRVQEEFSGIKEVMKRYVGTIREDLENAARAFKVKIKGQLKAAFAPGGTVAAANQSVGKIRGFLDNLRRCNKDHAQVIKALNELNREIQKTIDGQFDRWQKMLEAKGTQLQIKLDKLLQDKSAPLLAKAQQKMGKLFNFEFTLTRIALASPTISSLQDNESFIHTKTSEVIVPKKVERFEEVTEYETKSSCFGGSKRVPVVKKQKKVTVVNEKREEITHEADEKKVEARWAQYVDRRLEIILNEVMDLLSPLLESRIEHYQQHLMNYVGGYRQILEEELEEKTKGQKHLEERIKEVDEIMEQTQSIASELSAVMSTDAVKHKEEEPTSKPSEQLTDVLSAIKKFDQSKLRRQERIVRMETNGFETELQQALARLRKDIDPENTSEDTSEDLESFD